MRFFLPLAFRSVVQSIVHFSEISKKKKGIINQVPIKTNGGK